MHLPLLKLVISSGSLIKTKSLLKSYGITSATPNPDTGEPFIFIAIDSNQNELFEHLAIQEKENITNIKVCHSWLGFKREYGANESHWEWKYRCSRIPFKQFQKPMLN